ncbi:collagen alpha-1(IV) chain-like, partial [Pomacea canaliculata]|uniref:collagen alpha-1(IV) chain-like n=1 Tax=Pomacea canaliculata TaxID=400727 RepID=UPI000D725A02
PAAQIKDYLGLRRCIYGVLAVICVLQTALLVTFTLLHVRKQLELQDNLYNLKQRTSWLVSCGLPQQDPGPGDDRRDPHERSSRQVSGSLTISQFIAEQEAILERHCTNESKLCITGLKGEPGLNGAQGRQGLKGVPGDDGEQGIAGPPGAAGVQGFEGEDGPPGTRGEPGSTGPPGLKGEVGSQGAKGDPGLAGAQGRAGVKGLPGAKGDVGLPGLIGVHGAAGSQGSKGDQVFRARRASKDHKARKENVEMCQTDRALASPVLWHRVSRPLTAKPCRERGDAELPSDWLTGSNDRMVEKKWRPTRRRCQGGIAVDHQQHVVGRRGRVHLHCKQPARSN